MIVAIDVDGVLRNFTDKLIEVYQRENPSHTVKPITAWDLSMFFHIGNDIWDFAFSKHAKEIFEDAHAYPGASSFTKHLIIMGHKIIIVTTQPRGNEVHTINWLIKNDIQYDSIAFTKDKHIIDADIFLDDSPDNIRKLREYGKFAVVMRRPWNEHIPLPATYSYEGFYKYLSQEAL